MAVDTYAAVDDAVVDDRHDAGPGSQVIDRALADGPQVIPSRSKSRGQRVGRGVAAQDQTQGYLAEFFAISPLRDSDFKIMRSKDGPYEIKS